MSVLAWDQETDSLTLCEVVRCYERQVDVIYILTVGDETIETTSEHPFYVADKGWYKASELKAGYFLTEQIKGVRSRFSGI